VFRARFEQDLDISNLDVLSQLAIESGLDPEALAYSLKSNAHAERVAEDGALAQAIGINGVPAALVGTETDDLSEFVRNAEPVIGAVPEEWMIAAIDRAIRGEGGRLRLRPRL
jgi:predicted DsbA family dithiol-disulfide isomerase